MSQATCGVCHTEPKKYKCPTCTMPYCSIACFKTHTATHPASEPAPPRPAALEIPQPPIPPPPPKYLRQKTDFSILATNPKFQDLLKSHPALLPALQNTYAATIEPEETNWAPSRYRGGGRGGRRGTEGRWTQKQGDTKAMKILKWTRDGDRSDDTQEAMAEFVKLIEELFGHGEKEEG